MPDHRVGPRTRRLQLRAFTVDDATAFHDLNSNPDVMRYTGEAHSESVEQAREAIAAYPDFDTVGYGRWGCELLETGEVIGFCGLKYLVELGETDVGFRFLPRYWGQGLATEACEATLAYAFDVLGLTQVIGLVLPENGASIRVLEKVGMRREGTVVTEGLSALRYVASV